MKQLLLTATPAGFEHLRASTLSTRSNALRVPGARKRTNVVEDHHAGSAVVEDGRQLSRVRSGEKDGRSEN